MLIKLWDWEKKWTCTQVFEGHTHYVMQIVINPKDNNTFASASLDRTVKVSGMTLFPLFAVFYCCCRSGNCPVALTTTVKYGKKAPYMTLFPTSFLKNKTRLLTLTLTLLIYNAQSLV